MCSKQGPGEIVATGTYGREQRGPRKGDCGPRNTQEVAERHQVSQPRGGSREVMRQRVRNLKEEDRENKNFNPRSF